MRLHLFKKSGNLMIKRDFLVIFLLLPFIFGASVILLTYFVGGDQILYWQLYESLKDASISDVMSLSRNIVSGHEPITAYLLWLGAQSGLSKSTYISILNVILALGVFIVLKKHRMPWYVYCLVFTNFYFIILLTGLERLKIAYIFLVYGASISGRLGTLVAFFSPFAHLQTIILFAGLFLGKSADFALSLFSRLAVKKNLIIYSSTAFLLLSAMVLSLHEAIFIKVSAYFGLYSYTNLLSLAGLIAIGLTVTRKRIRFAFSLISLLPAALVLGSNRVNMIAVTIFIYLLLTEHRLQHPAVVLLMLYFSIKSIPFIRNIFLYGNGYGGWLL